VLEHVQILRHSNPRIHALKQSMHQQQWLRVRDPRGNRREPRCQQARCAVPLTDFLPRVVETLSATAAPARMAATMPGECVPECGAIGVIGTVVVGRLTRKRATNATDDQMEVA
jgi:hypothetical protein